MTDLQNKTVIQVKGFLFLFLGGIASAGLGILTADWQALVLHFIAVWAFCRFYYFAFYVIQHYVDSDFRFAGLIDFAKYAFRRRGDK